MGRCLRDTIAVATGCEPVSNLDSRIIGHVNRDFAEKLILVPFTVDLCIHVLGYDNC